jgi:hypothetical protein
MYYLSQCLKIFFHFLDFLSIQTRLTQISLPVLALISLLNHLVIIIIIFITFHCITDNASQINYFHFLALNLHSHFLLLLRFFTPPPSILSRHDIKLGIKAINYEINNFEEQDEKCEQEREKERVRINSP